VKVAYGLIGAALLALFISWLVLPSANRIQISSGPVEIPDDVYDPVTAGEQTPDGYWQVLPRDAILPVYNPTFRSGADTDWPHDTLVIGVELGGEAKAYPVTFLNRREMVIDWIGGTPILVSW